ncbi:MAG: potassium channel family protein [Pseudomonadota bacterium]|nr:potassium channel family protein [Pseudomonadota bacterium]
MPSWIAVAWRIAALIGVILLMIAFHWMERNGLRDNLDGHVSFVDVVYFTMISATTTGYGDIAPVTTSTRLFDALVVTPIRLFLLLIFVGSAYLFVARRTWEKFVMKRIQNTLHDHIVIAGYGTKNRRAVEELIALETDPRQIVVIDCEQERIDLAESHGCTVMQGDATRDVTLRAAHLERAQLLIISAGRDDTSILICLTARHLAPTLRISIAINEQDNEAPARRAGADVVVNPFDFAGLLLATSRTGQHIADYLADLASREGKVQLIERQVEQHEIGRSLSELEGAVALRVIRAGKPYGFWRTQSKKLQEGDVIMEIRPTE